VNRRGLLRGILATGVAPFVCTTSGILMPGKAIMYPWGNVNAGEVLAWQEEFVGFPDDLAFRLNLHRFGRELARTTAFNPGVKWFKLELPR
jgi:hypothetical protein